MPTHHSSLISHSSSYYILDGRRLNTRPTTKGLFIHNGRKVVIK